MDKDGDHGLSKLTAFKKVEDNKNTEGEVAEQEDESKDAMTNDKEHDDDCNKATCDVPEFKKCVRTGKKGEIICECMVDKDKDKDQDSNNVKDSSPDDNTDEVAC